jgi:carboxyl-terminal processing protease
MQVLDGVNEFYTRNKRKVEDKGGIYPDIEILSDSISYVTMELIRRSLIFDFAVEFHNEHPLWQPDIQLADSITDKFELFIDSKNVDYDIEGERELEKLEKIALNQKYPTEILNLIEELTIKLDQQKESTFQQYRDQIARALNAELTEKYFGSKERDRILLYDDNQVYEALNIIKNDGRYSKILAVN